MRKLFLLCLIMLISVTTMAESYSGKIISGNKLQGLADATIQLFNNNVFVGGCKSKTDGSFSVNTSQKATRISVSYVGLESYTRKDSLGLPENLGVIALSTHNVGLKEVTVTGTLKQETYNKDIYLITDSMRKGTASSGQLLEKIPGFLRDWENDKLRVNGEEDIVLLVNDVEKSSDYAMRINPKRVKKVEITYNPTGKYEGRRMLLNLSLFDDYIGWDFVPYTNLQYGKNNMNQETVGESYTYSVNKLSFNITSAFSNVVNKESDSFTRMYADNYERSSQEFDSDKPNKIGKKLGYDISLGAEYQLAKGHSLSFQTKGTFNQSLDSTMYFITEKDNGNVAQYEQWNRDKYYSNDYNVGLFYRGSFGKLYVSSDLTYDYYNVREKRTYWSNSNLSETPTLGDKNYVFYDLSISRPLSKHFDFYADYNLAWRKYNDTDRNTDEFKYWSKNIRHFMLAMLTWHPVGSFYVSGGALWLGNSDDNNVGHIANYSWSPMGRLFYKPWRIVTIRSNFHISAMYPNLDQLTATEYQIDSKMIHGGNPLLKSSRLIYLDATMSIDKLFNIIFVNFYNKDMNESLYYSLLPTGMVKESYKNADWHRMMFILSGDYKLFKDCNLGVNLSYFHDVASVEEGIKRKGDIWKMYMQARYKISPLKLNVQASYDLNYATTPTLQGKYTKHLGYAKIVLNRLFSNGKLEGTLTATMPANIGKRKFGYEYHLPYFTTVTNSSRNSTYGPYVVLGVKMFLHGGKQVRMRQNSFNVDAEK